MKNTMVNILQQIMDKQTSQQFWAVMILVGIDAFVISQQENIVTIIPSSAVCLAITAATAYGIFYLIRCHERYYFYRSEQAKLLKNEMNVPNFMQSCPKTWSALSLVGVGFYVVLVLGVWVVTVVLCLGPLIKEA